MEITLQSNHVHMISYNYIISCMKDNNFIYVYQLGALYLHNEYNSMLAVFKVVVDLRILEHKPHFVSFPFYYPSYI